jgi:hypothetical protein
MKYYCESCLTRISKERYEEHNGLCEACEQQAAAGQEITRMTKALDGFLFYAQKK